MLTNDKAIIAIENLLQRIQIPIKKITKCEQSVIKVDFVWVEYIVNAERYTNKSDESGIRIRVIEIREGVIKQILCIDLQESDVEQESEIIGRGLKKLEGLFKRILLQNLYK